MKITDFGATRKTTPLRSDTKMAIASSFEGTIYSNVCTSKLLAAELDHLSIDMRTMEVAIIEATQADEIRHSKLMKAEKSSQARIVPGVSPTVDSSHKNKPTSRVYHTAHSIISDQQSCSSNITPQKVDVFNPEQYATFWKNSSVFKRYSKFIYAYEG